MAKQIETLYMKSLTNGALFEYMTETIDRAQADATVAEQLKVQLTVLVNKKNAYDEVLKLSQKSEQTKEIEAQDKLRDDNYYAYKQMVKALLGVAVGDQLTAAEKLQQHIKDYKIDPDDDLRKECGMMANFTDDLATKYADYVAALSLTTIVEAMSTANKQVSTLLRERDDANASRVAGETKAARTACETAYKNFVLRVNALSIVDGDHDYSTFIDSMNEQIEQYRKQVIAKRKSGTSDGGSTTE